MKKGMGFYGEILLSGDQEETMYRISFDHSFVYIAKGSHFFASPAFYSISQRDLRRRR